MDINSNTNGGSDSQDNSNVDNNVHANDGPNLGAIRKSGQQEVLKALGGVLGQQFGKTNDAIAYIQSLVNQDTGGAAKTNEGNSSSRGNSEMAELRNMITGLQTQLQAKDQAVRKTTLQSSIKETAMKNGFDTSMLDIATNLFESNIDYDESGNFFVKAANGSVKLDGKGNPYSLDQLAQDILKSRPKLAADEGRSGTGSKFGQGAGRNETDIPDASEDLEGWKKWKERNGIGNSSFKGLTVSVNKPIL